MAQEGLNNPEAFAEDQAKEALIGALILPVIVVLGFLAFLFVLAYTGILGGPYGVAKFFFWIVTIIYVVVGYTLYKVATTLKRAVQSQRQAMRKQAEEKNTNYREAEIIES